MASLVGIDLSVVESHPNPNHRILARPRIYTNETSELAAILSVRIHLGMDGGFFSCYRFLLLLLWVRCRLFFLRDLWCGVCLSPRLSPALRVNIWAVITGLGLLFLAAMSLFTVFFRW
jgi:hypothetical protein